jgi:hypothetical protein
MFVVTLHFVIPNRAESPVMNLLFPGLKHQIPCAMNRAKERSFSN